MLSKCLSHAFICLFLAAHAFAQSPGDLKHPDWHPDGKKLIAEGSCAGGIGLYVIDLDSRRILRIFDGPYIDGYPRWFPDGERIAFHEIRPDRTANSFVAKVQVDGAVSNLRMIGEGPFDIEPAPSPDGHRIAYSARGEAGQDIVILDLVSKEAQITKTDSHDHFPSWDGDTVTFNSTRSGIFQIYRLSPDTGAVEQITMAEGPNIAGFIWSDRKSLAYSSERSGDREIYLRSLKTGNEHRLTNRSGRDGYPKISPDGSKVAYHSVQDSGKTTINILTLVGGETRTLNCQDWDGISAPNAERETIAPR